MASGAARAEGCGGHVDLWGAEHNGPRLELRFCASGLALFVGFVSLYIRSLLTLCLVSFDTIFGLF
jgi:hypothetical protein